MQNTFLIGLSRQVALGRQLDVVANNLANINTGGYKSDGALFEEYVGQVARENQFPGDSGKVSFVNDRGIWHDFSQGAVEQTGSPLDVAVDRGAFLVVQGPDGERYTHNGSMQISAAGQLVNSAGLPVLGDSGPIQFQPNDRDIVITGDGRITVREGANAKTESFRGKLRLVTFAQPQMLLKDGGNNFKAPDGVTPQPATNARVTQGAIEKSNVNGVLEMTRMIEITRNYTQVAQMIQQQSDMHRTAIQQLAEVPN